MTNGWTDIRNADVVLAMGGNPAENHPVGFRFVMEAKRNRNAKLISVDPRFNRTAAVADSYTQIRVGTDIAFLGGLINYALTRNRYHAEYVKAYTNATYLLKDTYAFDPQKGVFSGWNEETKSYSDTSSWGYELDGRGFARTDPTMQHPRSVLQVMKTFYSRYTPEAVSNICGCTAEDFNRAAELITSTYTADRAGTIMYALGWTHHSHSVQLIHAAAMLQLLLGNIGRAGGGLNALRGHANIQGGTDCGMAYHNLPGYIPIPKAEHETLDAFVKAATPKALSQASMNFWSNTDRFTVSQLKAFYGAHATRENGFAYQLHPRLPQSEPQKAQTTPKEAPVYENWSWAYMFDHMYHGRMEGFFSFGMNPVSNGPHSRKAVAALSKLKWLVVAENFEQETAAFWREDIQALIGKKPEDVSTEVFMLPAANFAEKDGAFVNSARWIQWKWKAVDPPGEAKADQEIIARIFLKVRDLYERDGGRHPDAIRHLNWWYTNPSQPALDEVAKEINGWAISDVRDPGGNVVLRAGQQLARFLDARADGSTLSGNWLYIGMYTDAGNLTQRRSTADPSGVGRYPDWSFSWPANRRIMYNRCSADAAGRPWDATRPSIAWSGSRWVGDVPDYSADSPPAAGLGAFIMLPEGVARLFVPGQFVDGPWSEHYEPAESPVANPLHPTQSSNPAVQRFKTEYDVLGNADEYPIVCTTYRLTEHFHYWTKNNPYNTQLQPEFFVEIPEQLAAEKGIANGDRVRVSSARGSVEGVAMLTKRIKPMQVAGKTTYQIGFPIHWGFLGRGKQQGALANLVTPTIVDPNSYAPEYKGFLVKLEKV
jgi:formate dehydrogenase major subunit